MKQQFTAQSNILDWYKIAFPTDDDMFDYMDETATFQGLFNILDRRQDVYAYIGAYDSMVRERVFEKLAEIMGVEYDYIYTQWLES